MTKPAGTWVATSQQIQSCINNLASLSHFEHTALLDWQLFALLFSLEQVILNTSQCSLYFVIRFTSEHYKSVITLKMHQTKELGLGGSRFHKEHNLFFPQSDPKPCANCISVPSFSQKPGKSNTVLIRKGREWGRTNSKPGEQNDIYRNREQPTR